MGIKVETKRIGSLNPASIRSSLLFCVLACLCPASLLQLYPEHKYGFMAYGLYSTLNQRLFLERYMVSGSPFLEIQGRRHAVTYLNMLLWPVVLLFIPRARVLGSILLHSVFLFSLGRTPSPDHLYVLLKWGDPNWTLFSTEARDRGQSA